MIVPELSGTWKSRRRKGVVGVLSEEDRDVVVTGVSRIGVDEHVHTVITTFGNGVGLEIIALVKNR